MPLSSGHLFINLFIYLFIYWYFLMAGIWGLFLLCGGSSWVPPCPALCFLGCCHALRSTTEVGCLQAPMLPCPFGAGMEGRREGESHQCLSPSHRSPCATSPRCAPLRAHLCFLTQPPGGSLLGSCWICCCRFLEMVIRARMCRSRCGEKTKPGILLPCGEDQKRKAGSAECLKHN